MKKIILQNGDTITLDIIEQALCTAVYITRVFKIGDTFQTLYLSVWDDISFRGYTPKNTDFLEFIFDIEDPFYFCFNQFLVDDGELIIYDDDTADADDRNKYMIIKKENFSIRMIFQNKLPEDQYDRWEKFRIFIQNIGPDPRSKIDDYDFKCRIINFIRDCQDTIENGYQMTIKDYLDILSYHSLKSNEDDYQKKLV